jgi:hypothetical protein
LKYKLFLERGLDNELKDGVKALLNNYGKLDFILVGIAGVVKETSRDIMANNRRRKYNITNLAEIYRGAGGLDWINSELQRTGKKNSCSIRNLLIVNDL